MQIKKYQFPNLVSPNSHKLKKVLHMNGEEGRCDENCCTYMGCLFKFRQLHYKIFLCIQNSNLWLLLQCNGFMFFLLKLFKWTLIDLLHVRHSFSTIAVSRYEIQFSFISVLNLIWISQDFVVIYQLFQKRSITFYSISLGRMLLKGNLVDRIVYNTYHTITTYVPSCFKFT